jgi:hypothetical protein
MVEPVTKQRSEKGYPTPECPLLADTVEKLGTWAEVTLRVKH